MSIHIRVKEVRSGKKVYRYLQLIKSERTSNGPRQKVLATLGRTDGNGPDEVDRLARNLMKFTRKVKILRDMEDLRPTSARRYGDVFVAERLWKDIGLEDILRRIGSSRDNEFSLERAVFSMVYGRLSDPGSKLFLSEKLREEYFIDGTGGLELQHLYRSLDILHEHKEQVEERLFTRKRDLFSHSLNLVFFDTTST